MVKTKIVAFIALSLAVVAAVVAYVYWSHGRDPVPAASVVPGAALATPATMVYFRHNSVDSNYGRLARTRLVEGAPREILDGLECEVVHVAAGRGLCLTADRGLVTTYAARIFATDDLRIVAEFPLDGIPSRCRVAADGRRAALTVFVFGHGYDTVDFSTQTLLIDLESGTVLADLESFVVEKDGIPFQELDFNFWGVTFEQDSRRFFATLSTGGEHYLVHGDAVERRARVVRKGVECPSLSPDGQRLAFKKRSNTPGLVHWSIAVLDLADNRETVLVERNSVDDQIEWLDNARVLYAMPSGVPGSSPSTDTWVAQADGHGRPELFLGHAFSPAVIR